MMRQPDRKPRVRDTVFMSGWLFADLLLALAVLFLAANTIGIKIPPPPPPKLMVTPTHLSPTSSNCTSNLSQFQCTVTLTETADSQGDVNWTAVSDISTGLVFTPASRFLSPGMSINIQISHITCENDSFTFSGSRGAIPVRILWQCTPPQERLDFSYRKIILQNVDYNGLLSDSPQAIGNLKHGIEGQSILKNKSVGLAIMYGGAPDDNYIQQAYQIAGKAISVSQSLVKDGFLAFQRASYYGPLYSLRTPPTTIEIDVYLFIQ
jgi:hypothetical protein